MVLVAIVFLSLAFFFLEQLINMENLPALAISFVEIDEKLFEFG